MPEPGAVGDETLMGSPGGWGAAGRVRSPLVVAGALSMASVGGLAVLLALPNKESLGTVLTRSLAYVGASGAAGAAAIWLLWRMLARGQSSAPVPFVQAAAEGCVFLPCIVVLGLKQTLWILPGVMVATLVASRGLGYLFPAKAVRERETVQLGALFGLPGDERSVTQMFLLAVGVEAAAIAAAAGYLGCASGLLAVWLLMMIWRVREGRPGGLEVARVGAPEWRRLGKMTVVAVALTWFLLLPRKPGGLGGFLHGLNDPVGRDAGVREPPHDPNGYTGIILWPPPQKKTAVVLRKRRTTLFAAGKFEPVVIPFDGPYWYFKAPERRPSARAHVARGVPTELNIRSTDRYPLLMEAHQTLTERIDLSCCREIDVAVLNGDAHPGAISVGLILSDSASRVKARVSLGVSELASPWTVDGPVGRSPVLETLRFPVPETQAAMRFDEMTVVFLPARERAAVGAKVTVRSFSLLPR